MRKKGWYSIDSKMKFRSGLFKAKMDVASIINLELKLQFASNDKQ